MNKTKTPRYKVQFRDTYSHEWIDSGNVGVKASYANKETAKKVAKKQEKRYCVGLEHRVVVVKKGRK